ncbi:hypothetical protein WJX81_003313 [Elliptochloris bilobata]|uniref:Uncharacterized protein n=1 Tax=Elliptochloris bilobata TaxID=381761 RepID=A0AAW1RH47_9CHLO
MSAEDKRTRLAALKDLQDRLLNVTLDEEHPKTTEVAKALLLRLDDSSEACRETAVEALLALFQSAPKSRAGVLPYLTAVLEERLLPCPQTQAVREPSEEVRLLLVRLLAAVLNMDDQELASYGGLAAALLAAACADAAPAVARAACEALAAWARHAGMRLRPVSQGLVAAALPLVTHPHCQVRAAAVRAVRALVPCGSADMLLELTAFQDPHSVPVRAFYGPCVRVNFCARLAVDASVQVRREFIDTLAEWLLELPQSDEHRPRLLPYLLAALADPSPDLAAAAASALDALGAQYEREHASELKDVLEYLPASAHALGWQRDGVALRWYTDGTGQEGAGGGSPGHVAPGPGVRMLPPFSARPGTGVRLLVQAELGSLVASASAELGGWDADHRARAALLLRTALVCAEEAAARHVHVLLPALCQAMCDGHAAPAAADCCRLVGAFVAPGAYVPLAVAALGTAAVGGRAHRGALAALAALLQGAGVRGDMSSEERSTISAELAAALDALRTTEDTFGESGSEPWAMAALSLLTHQADLEQERTDLAAAMRVSLEEAEQREAAPPLHKWPDVQLLEHFARSALLPQLQRLACGTMLFAEPLRQPVLHMLELERNCCKWFHTAGTCAYFEALGAEVRERGKTGAAWRRRSSAAQVPAAAAAVAEVLAHKAALVEAEAFGMPAVGGQVPPIFAALEPPPAESPDTDELQVIGELPAPMDAGAEPAAELD